MSEKSYHHGDLKNALVQAGMEILAEEGVAGLSLRKTALKAGVSHAAPYAHFADKQALIAAIATEGYRRVYERIYTVSARFSDDPLRRLVESAWAYVCFGMDEPALFVLTFSGLVEQEHAYEALVDVTNHNFEQLQVLVRDCQAAGVLQAGDVDVVALGLWGLVHGFIELVKNHQVSGELLERYTLRQLLIATLGQIIRVPFDPDGF